MNYPFRESPAPPKAPSRLPSRTAHLARGWLALLAFVLLLGISGPGKAQDASTPATTPSETEAAKIRAVEQGLLPLVAPRSEAGQRYSIAERMETYGVPGLSLAVIRNGEVVWTKAYGFADLEGQVPVTPETLFQAASISKPVAATAALRLVQEGKLKLDADINEQLTGWKLPPSPELGDRKVTLRHLLTHTAGLTVHGFGGYPRGEPLPTTVQILDGQSPANSSAVRVDIAPDDRWRYSGGGYTVMQLMVEEAAKKPFGQVLNEAVLKPFGMNSSSFSTSLPKPLLERTATGYYPGQSKVAGQFHVYPEQAAAALWTTPTDLARFAIGLQKAALGESEKVLKTATIEQMLQKHKGNWGLGPAVAGDGVEKNSSSTRFSHGGRNEGFDSQLVAYAYQGVGAVLMINTNENEGFLSEVIASIARAYDWLDFPGTEQRLYSPISAAELEPFKGTFEPNKGDDLRVFVWKKRLWLSSSLGSRVELLNDGKDEFFTGFGDGRLKFQRDRQGQVVAVDFVLGRGNGVAKRK